LGDALKNIHVPDQVLGLVQKAMVQDRERAEEHKQREMERLNQRLRAIRHRIDRAYLDRLDGKSQTTANCNFELSSRCHKRLSHLQKALRLDLRSSQSWGMVRPKRLELPTRCFEVRKPMKAAKCWNGERPCKNAVTSPVSKRCRKCC
jgi:hypothetical protein